MTYCGHALGYAFTLKSFDPERLGYACALFAELAPPPDATPRTVPLSIPESGPAGEAIEALVGTVNLGVIAAAAGNVLVHAGGAARPDGGTVIVGGPSGSGKSTLTARLLERGAAYVSDETICLRPDTLRIDPYRKPVSLKPGAQPLFTQHLPRPGSVAARCTDRVVLVPAARMGAAPLPAEPLLPQLLVFPTYVAGEAVHVEQLAPADAAYRLGSNCSRVGDVRGGPLPALARVARRAPAYALISSDLDAAADAVEALWDQA